MSLLFSSFLFFSLPSNCGESCIAPSDVATIKKLEPQLTKATTAHPCEEQGFTTYVDTETHELGPVAMELDMYTKPKST